MRSELKQIEYIENYLMGKLSFEEKSAFETEMQNDSSLKNDVELQKNITVRIALNSFIGEIQSYHPEFVSKNNGGGKGKWFLNSIIVLLVSGATALAVFFSGNKGKENNSIESNPKTTEKNEKVEVKTFSNTVVPINNTPTKSNVVSSTNYFSGAKSPKNPTVSEPGDFIEESATLKRLQVPFEELKMDAQTGKTFLTKTSNSKIFFPAGILQHEDGSKVEGEVTIRYREWRNAAEMAFSKIPMTVNEYGEELNFNSAGMIEIRAVQNGEELKIGKETFFTIDYNVTGKLDSCYFWSLNDESQKWKKLNRLEFNNSFDFNYSGGTTYINPELKDTIIEEEYGYGFVYGTVKNPLNDTLKLDYNVKFISKEMKGLNYGIVITDTGYLLPKVPPGRYMTVVSAPGYNSYTIENVEVVKNKYTELNIQLKPERIKNHAFYKIRIKKGKERRKYNRSLKETRPSSDLTNFKNIPMEKQNLLVSFENLEDEQGLTPIIEITSKPVIPENIQKANKNYSNLVTGLRCAGFGVYNCDQVRRMKNPVNVRPSFGESLPEAKPIRTNYLVLVDKDINASFSFYSDQISCSKDGRNTLLIYSGEKVYAVMENDFRNGKKKSNGNTEFKLTDITEQVQSIEDLKKFLGL